MNVQQKCAVWCVCAALLLPPPAWAQKLEVPRPKLVVVLVVDQMRADYVDKFQHQWTKGLRRLLEQGAWFRQAAYPYLNTYTCAGHATISTGSLPATHGVIDNSWWDRELGKPTTCTEDPRSKTVSYGTAVNEGHSAAHLRVPTLADELRAQSSAAARVVTFSLKARSAIMLAGHRADVATWFDWEVGVWETSEAYAASPLALIQKFVQANPVERDFGKSWTPALPEQAYLYANETSGEQPEGNTSSFPHVLKGTSDKPDAQFYRAWEASPFSDAYLVELAKAAVDAYGLGKGPGTDFLGVSFSALDPVGHALGPRSHELQDVLVRLDASIGALLDHLDRVVGPENYVVALSSDHGVAPIPEQISREGFDSGRIVTSVVVERAEKALEPFLGPGKHVAGMLHTDFYFALGVYDRLVANPAATKAAMDAILSVPGVSRVFRSEELRDRRCADDPITKAAMLSYFRGRSGDLIVAPRPYWFITEAGSASRTAHGTAYGYDQRVPLILMGRGIRHGEFLESATPADIAPTLAFLCGITLARTDGRVLREALAVESVDKLAGKSLPKP